MFSLTMLRTIQRLGTEPNFTRVAEELHLTQPAVTHHVRSLAAHFGVALVDLVGRRAVLTEAGRFLAERATPILGYVDALERDMHEFAAAASGRLRIGASDTIGNYVLPDLLAAFARQHPGVRADVVVGNTTEIIEQLRAGEIALALVEGDAAGEDLAWEPFADDALTLVVPPGHRLAGRDDVSARDLDGESFVAREPGSGTRALFERGMRDAGVEPNVVLALPSGEAVVRAVAAGIGLAVVSPRASADARQRGRVVEVAIDGVRFARRFRAARIARLTLAPAASSFLAILSCSPRRTRSGRPAR
jgi:DNA-binding transcriptional LysR family regulator